MDWISIEPEIQALTPLERRVLELLNEGHHYFRIAGMLHLSFETVRAIIFNIRKKESVLMGKLTNTEKAAIFQAWKDGVSQADLAKQYKVSGSAICTLIKRLSKAESEIMQTEDKPERMEKVKPVKINHEFEDAVDAMIAEEKSANAEPDKLPHYIWVALDDQVSAINWEIEQREQRIAELKEELVKLEDRRSAIESWVEEQKWL